MIDFPHDIALISNVSITHNTPQYVTESLNLQKRSRDRGIHRIEGTFDVTVEKENIRAFEVWLLNVRGRLNTFYLELGDRFTSETANNNPLVATQTPAGANSLPINGLSGTVSAGDYFNIANDEKTYMCMVDTSNVEAMTIFPELRQQANLSSQIVVDQVKILSYLTEDTQTIDYTEAGQIATFSCDFVEALQ